MLIIITHIPLFQILQNKFPIITVGMIQLSKSKSFIIIIDKNKSHKLNLIKKLYAQIHQFKVQNITKNNIIIQIKP
jgi:hypothetical protein